MLRFRKLFRFRLRTALLLLTFSCVGLGWYMANARARAAEVAALQQINDLSGYGVLEIVYDDDSFGWCGTGYNGTARLTGRGPQWLHRLLTAVGCNVLYRTKTVTVYGDEIDDTVIEPLQVLKSVDRITLDQTNISADGVTRLRTALPRTEIVVIEAPPENPEVTQWVTD